MGRGGVLCIIPFTHHIWTSVAVSQGYLQQVLLNMLSFLASCVPMRVKTHHNCVQMSLSHYDPQSFANVCEDINE